MQGTIKRVVLPLLLVGMVAPGCTHQLRVKNLQEYARPLTLGSQVSRPPKVAIMPFAGTPDALFYFNAIVERLGRDPGMGELRTDFIARLARGRSAFQPDIIVSIIPTVTYRSSGWNFLINWPGFLIFAPAWNGYIYHADVLSAIRIYDRKGEPVDQFDVPMTYSIRHADMNRTIFSGLGWITWSATAFLGGIYNAAVFDRDVIGPAHVQIKDNYAEFVLSQTQKRIQSVAEAIAPEPGSPSAVEDVFMTPPDETDPPDVGAPGTETAPSGAQRKD